MQETYILTVKTEDGKLLTQEKITGGLSDLYWVLLQLSNQLALALGASEKSETGRGSGIIQFASDSS